MPMGARLTATLSFCGVVGALLVAAASAFAEGLSSPEGAVASPLSASPLVTPGSPVKSEQVQAALEARLNNPGIVAEREASRTKFEGLNAEEAAKVAGEAFPATIDDPAGGPPPLPAGDSITGYPTNDVAQVDLSEGEHGLIESTVPIAVETSPGQRTPIDLSLHEAGGAFEPKTAAVGVRIPKRLSDGVSLAGTGVSLTPVNAQGSSLGGSEGTLDGATVFFANTQTDADTIVKSTTLGFETDTLLRSELSPQRLSFRVGMPSGASLVQTEGGSGSVQVIKEGAVVARVLAPSAEDAAGTSVPVSMSVTGDTVTIAVADSSGEYEFPIAVDPTVDEQLTGESKPTRWKFGPFGATHFTSSGWKSSEGLTLQSSGTYKPTEEGYLYYEAQGESKITEASLELSGKNTGNIETLIEIAHLNGSEEVSEDTQLVFPEKGKEYGRASHIVCDDYALLGECNLLEKEKDGAPHNLVKVQQSATAEGAGENTAKIYQAAVDITQAHGPEKPTFNTSSPELYNGEKEVQNVLYGAGGWLSPANGAFEVKTKDPGIGVSYFGISSSPGSWVKRNELFLEGKCEGVICFPEFNQTFTYNKELSDGNDYFSVLTEDLSNGFGPEGGAGIKVDGTPPHGLILAGLPASGVINEAQYHLRAQAIDGKAPTPSSGIKSLVLGLDGYTLPGKAGSCAPGPCSATGEWTIDGETFGAGKHTLTLVATDNAGNVEKREYSITVRHASSLPVGPGSVDLITGALHLGGSDVSLGSGGGSLGVSRGYNSRQPTAGEQGPFGPQWSISVNGSQMVEQEPTGSVVLVSSDGGRTTFESNGKGGFAAPKGDENLVLEAEKEGEKVKAYLLKNQIAGTTVKYTQPGGAGPWVVASSEDALTKTNGEKEAFEWERLEGVTRPKMALAPSPKGVTCSLTVKEPKELADGCRALSFTYATETTATGEGPGEWKTYKGRLEKVSFTAYNPSTKAMGTTPVATYAYDKQGRLRAEWDPRLASPLKTTYGYDTEGHVVAVNPPGQEPWLLHYGTTTSDTGAGRLLSVTRPPAGTSSQVKEQNEKSAPGNTAVPTLSSTSPAIGTTLSISSNGTWSNSPLAYSDSWEDCYFNEVEFKETCTAIPGAVDNSYTPQARDAGYELRGKVTAGNSDGSTSMTTVASKAIPMTAPAYLRKFGEKGENEKGQLNVPAGAAIDAAGDVWVVDHGNARVEEWSESGTWLHTYGKKGAGEMQFESPEGIAINTNSASPSYGDVYVADKGNNRIEEFSAEGKYIRAFGKYGKELGQLNSPEGLALVPAGSSTSGELWVGDAGNDRVDEFSETGEWLGSFGSEGSGNGQLKAPDGIAFSGEDAYVVDSGNDRVQKFSMSGEYVTKFGSKGTGGGQFEIPYGIATEPVSEDLFVADSANNRVEEFSPAGAFLLAYGKKGEGSSEFSTPQSVASNSSGDVYVADSGNNRVQELEPKYSTNNPLPEPPVLGTSLVSTIEYNVPLAGSGAPHEMIKAELEKWDQTDDPAEPVPGEPLATAVFPPDEPMGWPAKDYKRATITYLDELGRTVNRALPSGGIATSQYNEANEVIRSLSADNRAAALKEGSKSGEVSELLDTKSRYNGETKEEKEKEEKEENSVPGTRLLETRGPQHTIRLAGTTTEKQARNHVKYFYDEGSPGGKRYNLVTKTTDGAEYEGKESEVRTTTTAYSGQENLGWLLRKPTSVTTDPSGLNLTRKTIYELTTGNVVETRDPESEILPSYSSQFGSKGTGNGQFEYPQSTAIAPDGNVYVTDSFNSRVEEFSPTGEYITKWGSEGKENGQLEFPGGVAVAPSGNVYVADTDNNRVEEFSPTGEYVTKWGIEGKENGQFKNPGGLAVSSSGNVYVADTGNDRVEEFSATGIYIAKWGSEGKENGQFKNPYGVAVSQLGNVYVADTANNRVEEFSSTGTYIAKWGSEGKEDGQFKNPYGVAVSASGSVYVADTSNDRIQEFSAAGAYIMKWGTEGKENGQFKTPHGVAIASTGNIYVADANNNRIQEFSPFQSLGYDMSFGSEGKENGQFNRPEGVATAPSGNVYVVDARSNRVQEFTAVGSYIMKWGSEGKENGQFKEPGYVAIAPSGNVYVTDKGNDRVEEFSSTGTYITKWGSEGKENGQFKGPKGVAVASNGDVYVADSENSRVQEFSSSGAYIAKWGSEGKENGQFKTPKGVAIAPSGNVYVADAGNNRLQEFSSTGTYVAKWGSEGKENGQFKNPSGVAIASSGNVYVTDTGNKRVQEFFSTGEYITKAGSEGEQGGQFFEPMGVAVNSNGNVYVADPVINERVQEWTPGLNAHDSQLAYYAATADSTEPRCGEHPEWAGLPCRTRPAVQPGISSRPELPVTTTTYNMWDELETVTEKFGSTTRTKKMTYDSAGRLLTTQETSSIDTSLPTVTNEYSPETGAMTAESTTIGETTKSIKSVYNTLDQLTEYTDADGNTTQYVYSGPANDDRVEEVNFGSKKGSQIYSYDPTTKALTKLLDVGPEGGVGAGTFTASYDVEGKMISETYPNGMMAKYTFNTASEATGIEYEKTTHCTEKCTWFSETIAPSIHGEALARSSTLAKDEYTYDNAGRLTQVNETPSGKGCRTRLYAYNEDSNRISETTRESATETCATSGGITEIHAYDEADRLIDTGVEYETFGDQTKVPASDAGEHEITATFYVDDQVASQKQNGETTHFSYDPAGRTEQSVSEGTTNSTVTNHYAGPGEAISWTSEEEGKKWARNIPGIDGSLSAVEKGGETAVLQLHDLEGNIVATAAKSETETKLLSTYNSTEFGVQVNGTPPTKYSWLGASGLATEPSSGATASGGASYVPQLGAPLQTQPIEAPGKYANGSYSEAAYMTGISAQSEILGTDLANGAPEREASRQAAIKKFQEEEEQRALELAELEASMNAPSPTEGGAVGTDPPHVLFLFTPAEAIADGEALCNCSVVRGAGVVIEAIANKIGVEGLGEAFEEFMEAGAAEGFGKELLNCGRYLNSNSKNRCALEINTWEFLGQDTYIPTEIHIGACYYYKKSFQGKKRGLNCSGGEHYNSW
jgi:tripartite motif-containing protein 71